MSESTSIYKTEKYPASAIYQNHIDIIHGLLEKYCSENKTYEWYLVVNGNRRTTDTLQLKKYLTEKTPKTLSYRVRKKNTSIELILEVNNGVTISIKNGTYRLYGLYKRLMDESDLVTIPPFFAFLRRHWAANLLVAVMVVPILVILLLGGGWWSLLWVLVCGFIELFIISSMLDTSDWSDYMLSTSIRYGEYNNKTLSAFSSVFSSFQATMSLLASIATVVTFIVFIINI